MLRLRTISYIQWVKMQTNALHQLQFFFTIKKFAKKCLLMLSAIVCAVLFRYLQKKQIQTFVRCETEIISI